MSEKTRGLPNWLAHTLKMVYSAKYISLSFFRVSLSSLLHFRSLSYLPSRLGPHPTQTSDKMAGTTVTLSAQEKGPGGLVTSPLFVHPLADQATGDDVIVGFDAPDDPYNPLNWTFKKKVLTTFLYGMATCWITFASAVYTAALVEVSHEFGISLEVSTLGISLFVVGFAVGPMVFSPLSEVYGRKFVVLIVCYSPQVITPANGL